MTLTLSLNVLLMLKKSNKLKLKSCIKDKIEAQKTRRRNTDSTQIKLQVKAGMGRIESITPR